MQEMGKALVAIGLLLAIVGAVMYFSGKTNLPIGRLPGDITYRKGNFTLYAPIATSILLSIILSLIFWFISRR